MSALSFFRPILDALNEGKVIRTTVLLCLKALSLFCVIGGIYLLIDVLKASFEMPTEGTIGGILFSAFLLASIITVVQILLYRAGNIRQINDSPFTVIPVCSMLFRAFGEAYSALGLGIGMGGCIFIWLSKDNPIYYIGDLGKLFPTPLPEMTILGGLLFLGYFALTSFVVFVVSYFLAEAIMLMADAARNHHHPLRHSSGVAR